MQAQRSAQGRTRDRNARAHALWSLSTRVVRRAGDGQRAAHCDASRRDHVWERAKNDFLIIRSTYHLILTHETNCCRAPPQAGSTRMPAKGPLHFL